MKTLCKYGPERLEKFAYDNRREPTPAESAMTKILAEMGWRFNIEHPYPKKNIIVDFMVPAFRLVIEVDGGYHVRNKDRDRERDKSLVRRGFLVQRFTNEQVIKFPKRTRATLLKRISAPVSSILPTRLNPSPRVRSTFIPNLPCAVYER